MASIFSSHFDAIRARLLAEGQIANAFQHNTNKGNIREVFAKEMLNNSTPQFCSVGSGEIIHRHMQDDEERNQIDVILYNNRFPKLTGAGGVDLFFVETVSSFIEVKSTLSKADIRQAAKASKRIKSYPYAPPQRFNPTGMVKTPRPFSFLFAYGAQVSNIDTVAEWMKDIAAEDDYNLDALIETHPSKRRHFPNLFLDGVFVLGKGYVTLDAMPFESPSAQGTDVPNDHIWIRSGEGELEVLWAAVNIASEKLLWNEVELGEYVPPRMIAVSN
ncbi:DUF6602 domain-containing protein [Leisingera caerulea]|uniref:DUF6602 domain-containing protein n=1 Tax=Leisingera caerulea TaxID=506591 RepID=A0A9Q9HP72_LEICA|nr:DUF6602 domain-containing protein [Leisingera caerulea]UWQ55965.1 hypothetical protein K3721_19215 [Leisingera caerulea]